MSGWSEVVAGDCDGDRLADRNRASSGVEGGLGLQGIANRGNGSFNFFLPKIFIIDFIFYLSISLNL